MELEVTEKASVVIRLDGADVGTSFHWDVTPIGVASLQVVDGTIYAWPSAAGETVLRVWPFGAPREDPRAAEATITVTGDGGITIEFGPAEPK